MQYSDYQYRKLRQRVFIQWQQEQKKCFRCGKNLNWEIKGHKPNAPTLEHISPLALGGDELPPFDECAVSHLSCNSRHGAKLKHALAGHKTKPNNNQPTKKYEKEFNAPLFDESSPQSRACPKLSYFRHVPKTLSDNPRFPEEFDGLPTLFPDIHPLAVGSLGDEFAEFAEQRSGRPLLWWQWVCAQRAYEVDADGRWCWPLVFTSVSRQSGKSWSLAEDACWSISRATGEFCTVLHSSHVVTLSRNIQSTCWDWGELQGHTIHRLLGESRIITPHGEWLAIAMSAAYGRRPGRLLIDEAWSMDPAIFWDSVWPAMGAATNPQALMFSAATVADKGLARALRSRPEVARMEWGMVPGEDPRDPAVWRLASPRWNTSRGMLIGLAIDSPNALSNWLNAWPEEDHTARRVWIDPDDWAAGKGDVGTPHGPVATALDSTPDGLSFRAAAVWVSDGRVHLRVSDALATRDTAVEWVARFRPQVCLVGVGLHKLMPRNMRWPFLPAGQRETATSSGTFAKAVRDRSVIHDGSLDGEVANAVAEQKGSAGLVLVPSKSDGDVTRLKLAVWLTHHVQRNDFVVERPRIL